MKIHAIIVLLVLSLVFSSCDEVSSPYSQSSNPVDTSKYRNQNVVLFEFTGQFCGYCPPASATAQNLEHTYDGRLFAISIHAGLLASFDEQHPLDFNNPDSKKLYEDMQTPENPKGCINFMKKLEDGSYLFNYSEWEQNITPLFQNEAPLDLYLEASLNKSTRKIQLSAKQEYLATGSSKYRIVAYIVEDGIVGYQKWIGHNPIDVFDYVHNNVSRGTMNGTYGTTFTDVDPKKGDTIQTNLEYTISQDKDWNLDNLKLVVLIQNPDDYKVIQVAGIKL